MVIAEIISILLSFFRMLEKVFTHFLDRIAETYKYKLMKEHTQFLELHPKQSKAIIDMSALLNNFYREIYSLACPLQGPNDFPRDEQLKRTGEAGQRFSEYYNENKIYFDAETSALLDEINREFGKAWIALTLHPVFDKMEPRQLTKERHNSRMEAWDIIREKILPLKEKIEHNFKNILGITN